MLHHLPLTALSEKWTSPAINRRFVPVPETVDSLPGARATNPAADAFAPLLFATLDNFEAFIPPSGVITLRCALS